MKNCWFTGYSCEVAVFYFWIENKNNFDLKVADENLCCYLREKYI
jgi:hypothetical protein